MTIRPALPSEAALLSALAIRSKAGWGYPPALMETFRAELTLDPSDLADSFVSEEAGRPVGFYTLEPLSDAEVELGHLFIDPDAQRRGHGRALVAHARTTARARGFTRMIIQSDPHAAPFYESCGAQPLGTRPSSIPGRVLPLYALPL
jgi:GNAT superfamily N-acetyltransferase